MRTAVFKTANDLVGWLLQQAAERNDSGFYHAMEHAGLVLAALIGKDHPDYKVRHHRWAKRLLSDKVQALIQETVIDPRVLKIVATIPTGQPESHMLAITRDGRRGYTSNVGSGTVSVLDLEARMIVTNIPVAPKVQRISLSADDRWAFTADQSKPQLAMIDTALNQVKTWIPLPDTAYGTAPTPNGRWLLVVLIKLNKLGVIDLDSLKVVRTLNVPRAPQEVLVRPDGAAAYVSCDASHQVAVINLKNWKVEKLIDAGAGADGLGWTQPN